MLYAWKWSKYYINKILYIYSISVILKYAGETEQKCSQSIKNK
jgi:hypothetical protein